MSLKELRNTRSWELSSMAGSQSCLNFLNRLSIGNRPKFIDPILRLATSGFQTAAGFIRSSTVIYGEPPVVRLTTTLDCCLMARRNGSNASGDWSGRPSCGLRAWRCTIAAPASAAPNADSAISTAVTGRWGDIDGVWIDPVIAQEMMTLRDTIYPSVKCVQAMSGRGRHRWINRRHKMIVEQADHDVNL